MRVGRAVRRITSHTVAAGRRLHQSSACSGRARENGTSLIHGVVCQGAVGSFTRILRSRSGCGESVQRHQAVVIAMPSMSTPWVTYFHTATRSLRASAVIITFLKRPPFCLTRSWNQRLSAVCG